MTVDENGYVEMNTSNEVRDEADPLLANLMETTAMPLKKELVSVLEMKLHFFCGYLILFVKLFFPFSFTGRF